VAKRIYLPPLREQTPAEAQVDLMEKVKKILTEDTGYGNHLIFYLKKKWKNIHAGEYIAVRKTEPHVAVLVHVSPKKKVELRFSVEPKLYDWIYLVQPELKDSVIVGPELPYDSGDPWWRWIGFKSFEELKLLAG